MLVEIVGTWRRRRSRELERDTADAQNEASRTRRIVEQRPAATGLDWTLPDTGGHCPARLKTDIDFVSRYRSRSVTGRQVGRPDRPDRPGPTTDVTAHRWRVVAESIDSFRVDFCRPPDVARRATRRIRDDDTIC